MALFTTIICIITFLLQKGQERNGEVTTGQKTALCSMLTQLGSLQQSIKAAC